MFLRAHLRSPSDATLIPPHPSSGSSLLAFASSSGKSSIFWISPCGEKDKVNHGSALSLVRTGRAVARGGP